MGYLILVIILWGLSSIILKWASISKDAYVELLEETYKEQKDYIKILEKRNEYLVNIMEDAKEEIDHIIESRKEGSNDQGTNKGNQLKTK